MHHYHRPVGTADRAFPWGFSIMQIKRRPGFGGLRAVLSLTLVVFSLLCASTLASAGNQGEVIFVHEAPRDAIPAFRRLGDFWGVDWQHNRVIMYVTPRGRAAIEDLGYRTSLDDKRTQALWDFIAVDRRAWRDAGLAGIPGFPCYRTVDETHADLAALANSRPELARWETIGQSWLKVNGQGGDEIKVLVLGNQSSPHEQAPLMIMAAQHARELVTAESAARFAEWLVHNYNQHPTARWLLDHRKIHIIAQQNPDGRRAVENGQSMWRKNSNLSACPGGTPGVDLNRNSNYFWGSFSDTQTCSQVYRGASAGSEPETAAIQGYMDLVFERNRKQLSEPTPADAAGLFLSLHSFGNMMLFPWEGLGGGSGNHAPNHDQLAWLGRKLGYLTGYLVGRTILPPAGGTMTDYAYGEFGVAAYTYEIGTTFQQSCSSFEESLWPDVLDSLIYSAKAAELPYTAPQGPEVIGVQAIYDSSMGQLEITGVADDSRFDRGDVTEGPTSDPIHDIAEVRASFGVPPHQAGQTMALAFHGQGPIVAIDAIVQVIDPDLDDLLFLQAIDSEGVAGVPTAVRVEQRRARISPESFNLSLLSGQNQTQTLSISNIGQAPLNWTIESEPGRASFTGHQPLLDEVLSIDDFAISGGNSNSQASVAGLTTQGRVVGFSFEGTVSGISGNQTWASDLALNITSPDGSAFSVGGYNTGNPAWEFDGSGSNNDGSYTSSHIGSEVFGTDGSDDAGSWQFRFDNTWQDTMNWSDLSITLHKTEPPVCAAPEMVAWLQIDTTEGQTQPGESSQIILTVNADELDPGAHQALLCIGLDDPTRELAVIEVNVSVQTDLDIFSDRFETVD